MEVVVVVDVNEDNVAPTVFSEKGGESALGIDCPEITFERHRYFTCGSAFRTRVVHHSPPEDEQEPLADDAVGVVKLQFTVVRRNR